VVCGGRGAGKSSLFHFLGHIEKQPDLARRLTVGVAAPPLSQWLEGYSSSLQHPTFATVGAFGDTADDDRRRFFWYGWLCLRLSGATDIALPAGALTRAKDKQNPDELARAVEQQLGALNTWMDSIERTAQRPIVVTYDGLDRIGNSSSTRKNMTASLLAMWLSLADRYRNIRPKVFVREDLFQSSLAKFPDASKLDARSVSIEWRVEDLYRVLIKHMANTSDGLKSWIEDSTRGISLLQAGPLGWMPPNALPETGAGSQKNFVDHLVGAQMRSGPKQALSYRWIPNRLQDAHARAVPRSILSLIRNAAIFAISRGPQAKSLRLLRPEELQGALEQTSRRRVAEVQEEFPVVGRLESLRGQTVMLPRAVAIKALGQGPAADEFGNDGEQVLRTLIELGVMSERPDGRIDIADIYRYGFEIGRKGGVKRPR
jgi:hypothetical protein